MNVSLDIQIIKPVLGKPEYVLIPVAVYNALRDQIENKIAGLEAKTKKTAITCRSPSKTTSRTRSRLLASRPT